MVRIAGLRFLSLRVSALAVITALSASVATMAGCNLAFPTQALPGVEADAGAAADSGPKESDAEAGAKGGDMGPGGGPVGTPLDPMNTKSPLGTNITTILDYSSEIQLLDVYKSSRPWNNGDPNVALDATGNLASLAPGQTVTTYMLWDLQKHYPAGQYTVLYEGDASGVEYSAGATKNVALSKPGRDVLDVDPTRNGIQMTVKSLNPNDKLRNVHVILPGGSCSNDQLKMCTDDATCGANNTCKKFVDNYESQVFYPPFLEKIRHNKIIRFMDWLATNDSQLVHFADRPKLGDARYTVKGSPIELAIDVANRIGADPWINIPHMADDDFITQTATIVKSRMAPGHKVYVEYSNEVWNAQFKQFQYAFQQGRALGFSPGNDFGALLSFQSKRSVDVFKSFTSVFGDDAKTRLVRVMGSQAANDYVSDYELMFQDAYKQTDAVAIAPYFGGYLGTPDQKARVDAMNLDQLFSEIDTKALPEAIGWMNATSAVAKKYNVKMVAYEGGQHTVGVTGQENDATLNTLFDALNRDPRMKGVYKKYLDAWKASGGDMFVHFVNCGLYNKFGRWGAMEYLDEPREMAPKYDALEQFISDNPK
jgi:hypothetical protein